MGALQLQLAKFFKNLDVKIAFVTHDTLKKVKDATKIVSGFIDYFLRKNEAGKTFVHLETCTNHIIMFYLMVLVFAIEELL